MSQDVSDLNQSKDILRYLLEIFSKSYFLIVLLQGI